MTEDILIYTDGACLGNPGPGGWAAIIIMNGKQHEISGGAKDTTNNRMEMIAVINALKKIDLKSKVTINTDSKYVLNGITDWVKKWKGNNWLTSSKKQVKNEDLWKILDELSSKHLINWVWVKGHSGDFFNEKADKIARNESERFNH